MPAIQPARLKQQADLLVQHFDKPPYFVRGLHYLLEFYADRAIRPGSASRNRSLTPAYRVRQPVLRQILQELEPLAVLYPQQGLAICDALWEENFLEFRLLAGMLLGKIPVESSQDVIIRFKKWLKPDLEIQLMAALLANGALYLKQTEPNSMIQLAKDFLGGQDRFLHQVGLHIAISILSDPEFTNIPAFFRLLQPFVLRIDPHLKADLLEVIAILAERSPQETAYYLAESLTLPNNPDTTWIIRKSLENFPQPVQSSLRERMRALENHETR